MSSLKNVFKSTAATCGSFNGTISPLLTRALRSRTITALAERLNNPSVSKTITKLLFNI